MFPSVLFITSYLSVLYYLCFHFYHSVILSTQPCHQQSDINNWLQIYPFYVDQFFLLYRGNCDLI